MSRYTFKSGQTQLTPAQQAEVDQFFAERMQGQLATDPVDEDAAEALLCRAYEAVKLVPPERILWVDGPLEMVALLTENSQECFVDEVYREHISGWMWDAVRQNDEIAHLNFDTLRYGTDKQIRDVARQIAWAARHGMAHRVATTMRISLDERMSEQTALPLQRALVEDAHWPFGINRWSHHRYEEQVLWLAVSAFSDAAYLAYCHFLAEYTISNAARWLARFNELVSGYWCGATIAIVVRHPKHYARDAEGRLHSTTGRSLEYRDGWGFCAWHGIVVPDDIIQRADQMTREDFFQTRNLEERRVIQEMMGEQFIWEIGARFVDSGPRGVLYEVELPNDPERVARYVQVKDASTVRAYYLRVPPDIQTADEAVAWTFGLKVGDYAPQKET